MPPGAHTPAKGDDGVYEDCEVLHEGLCYRSETDACNAAGCPAKLCMILESYPGQVECPAGVHKAVKGASGRYQDCNILHDGFCFQDSKHACSVAGCSPQQCTVLRSDPGQIACEGP